MYTLIMDGKVAWYSDCLTEHPLWTTYEITIPDEELYKIDLWYNASIVNGKVVFTSNAESDAKEQEKAIEAAKQAKSEAINTSLWAKDKLDSIIKQINLIASTLDTITSDTPDQTIITEAKTKFAEIKTILNS